MFPPRPVHGTPFSALHQRVMSKSGSNFHGKERSPTFRAPCRSEPGAGWTPHCTEPMPGALGARRRLVLPGALSSDCGLSITGRHQPPPDTTPAATLLARLVWSSFAGVTSGEPIRVPTRLGMPRLPPRTRFAVHWTDFRGENTEAPPYPPWPNHSRFGSVSPATGWWLGITTGSLSRTWRTTLATPRSTGRGR